RNRHSGGRYSDVTTILPPARLPNNALALPVRAGAAFFFEKRSILFATVCAAICFVNCPGSCPGSCPFSCSHSRIPKATNPLTLIVTTFLCVFRLGPVLR